MADTPIRTIEVDCPACKTKFSAAADSEKMTCPTCGTSGTLLERGTLLCDATFKQMCEELAMRDISFVASAKLPGQEFHQTYSNQSVPATIGIMQSVVDSFRASLEGNYNEGCDSDD